MSHHIGPDTEKQNVEFSAIIGMLGELDPHSNFLDPDSYREFRVGTEGEFGGLGIVISIKEGRLTVTAPLEGTPAWRAGVKAGDFILQIDEESTINMSLTEAVQRLRGKPGSKVAIKIERSGMKEPLTVVMIRDIINIQSVQAKRVQTPKGHAIAFLRVKNFQSNTHRDVVNQLTQMSKQSSLKGVILDLRNNPGGLLDQSVYLADTFLKEGTIVSTVGQKGKVLDRKVAKADGLETEWPMIVLVNEGSASASEIVAGALKNNDRAVVIGTKTFGKGTVQSIYELPEQAAIKITIGQYLTPGEKSIQSIGIIPDIEFIPVAVHVEHLDVTENIQTLEKDLEKHIAQEAIASEKPSYQFPFLTIPPDKQEAVEYSAELNLKGDTAAELALNMMDAFKTSNRGQMLSDIQKLLQTKQGEEEKKIIAQFQKLGLDWQTGKGVGEPQAQLSYRLLKKGMEVKSVQAGEEVTLAIRVKNVGNGPFYRLSTQTDSKVYYFRNLEFAFGKVLPGETKEWKTQLKIPKANPSEEALLELHFKEANQHPLPVVRVILPIEGLPRPQFAHQFSLPENGFEQLRQGKPLTLTVQVSNEGKGTSLNTVVALRNLGGKEIFIEKGREVLKTLAPGQQETVPFRFHLDPNATPSEIRLELSITDADLIVRSAQELTLNLTQATLSPSAQQWYRPPTITLASKKDKATATPLLIEGEALDDQILRDLYIFVGEEKTFYAANVTTTPKLSFKTALPLQEGNNTVMITARDNDNLVSIKMQVIRLESIKEGKL